MVDVLLPGLHTATTYSLLKGEEHELMTVFLPNIEAVPGIQSDDTYSPSNGEEQELMVKLLVPVGEPTDKNVPRLLQNDDT